MAKESYKALTFVNLPFIEERFAPGQMIPREKFEAMAEQAASLLEDRTHLDDGASPVWTADDHINELLEWGSISEDADSPLHPDHLPTDPGVPTVASSVAQIRAMVEQMEAAGVEIPAKMRAFAEMSDAQIQEAEANRRIVAASENGAGGDANAG